MGSGHQPKRLKGPLGEQVDGLLNPMPPGSAQKTDIVVGTDAVLVSADRNVRLWVGQSICESVFVRSLRPSRPVMAAIHISSMHSDSELLPPEKLRKIMDGKQVSIRGEPLSGVLDAVAEAFDEIGVPPNLREAVLVPNQTADRSMTAVIDRILDGKVRDGRFGKKSLAAAAANVVGDVGAGALEHHSGMLPQEVRRQMLA